MIFILTFWTFELHNEILSLFGSDFKLYPILSGGNLDFDRLPDIKERYLIYKGLKKHFTLNLPHRPGALREFLDCLGPDDNIVYIHYSTSNEQWGNVRIGIQTSKKTHFDKIFQAIKKTGMKLVEVGKYHE